MASVRNRTSSCSQYDDKNMKVREWFSSRISDILFHDFPHESGGLP